jgi:hypothetical protein
MGEVEANMMVRSNRSRLRYEWIVGASVALFSASARADVSLSIVSGRVVDQKSGRPLGDVVVIVTSPSLQGERSVVSDDSGFFRMPNLPAGNYTVQMFRGSYQPFSQNGVKLAPGTSIRLNAQLVAEEDKAISVVVQAPTIDSQSSSTGVNFGKDFITRIPFVSPVAMGGAVRSFEAAAAAAPGARSDGYGISLGGTTSPENNYLVNGINTADVALGVNATPLSMEFLDDVQVLSGAYMPEYGLNTGGTISATIRSGSNEFHGHSWASFSPGALRGKPREFRREGSTIGARATLDWIGDIGADLGGPIVKDRLWFYTGVLVGQTNYRIHRQLYEFSVVQSDVVDENGEVTTVGAYATDDLGFRVRRAIPGTSSTYRSSGTTIQAVTRLTWAPSQNHQVDLSAAATPFMAGGPHTFAANPRNGTPGSPLNGLAVAANTITGSALNGTFDSLATKQTSVPIDTALKWIADADNKRWNFETQASWHHEQVENLPVDGSAPGSTRGLAGRPQVIWGASAPYHPLTDFEPLPSRADPNACGIWVSPNDPHGQTLPLPLCPIDQYATGGPGYIVKQRQDSLQFKHVITRLAHFAGHHEIKGGVNYGMSRFDNIRAYTGGAIYREGQTGGTFYDVRQYGYLTGPDEPVYLPYLNWTTTLHTARGFLQDSWAIADKVTLNAGALYDAQIMINGQNGVMNALTRQVSPRVGFVWDPLQNGRTKIRGHWGRYFQTMTLQIADRAGSGEPGIGALHLAPACDWANLEGPCRDPQSFFPGRNPLVPGFGQGTGTASRQFTRSGASRTPIDPNLRAQAKDELALGAQWEFITNHAIGLDLTQSRLIRAIEDMSRDEAATYFIGNPGEGIAADFPKATRDYLALSANYVKKYARHWTAMASYTLQYLRGNYNGLFRSETGQLDPNMTSDFDLASLLANRTGRLDGDTRHQFKVFGGGEVPMGEIWTLDLGASFGASSGRPTNVLGAHPLYGVNEVFILKRGSGPELPWVYGVNGRVGTSVALGKETRIGLSVDVYNLFNFQAPVARDQSYTYDTVAPIVGSSDLAKLEREGVAARAEDGRWVLANRNPNFGRAAAYQLPRQFTFALRLTF